MKSSSSFILFSRIIFLLWLAVPFVLILLNLNEIWLWTPLGKIGAESDVFSDTLSSTSWLLVFYLGPSLLMRTFHTIHPEKSKAFAQKIPPIYSEKFEGFIFGIFATASTVTFVVCLLMAFGYQIEKDPYHHHSSSGLDIG